MSEPKNSTKVSLADMLAQQQTEAAGSPPGNDLSAAAKLTKDVDSPAPSKQAKPRAKSSQATTDKPGKPAAKSSKNLMSLERFGLSADAQWLLTVPSRWEDYKTFTDNFEALYQGTVAMVRGKIVTKKMYDDSRRETTDPRFVSRVFAVIENRKGQRLPVGAFGKPGFAWKGYEKGSEVILRGTPKVSNYSGELELSQAEVVRASDLGKIHAIYPPIKGTKGERFAEKVALHRSQLPLAAQLLDEETGWNDPGLARTLCEVTQFSSSTEMLQELHWPSSIRRAEQAQVGARALSAWSLVRKTNQRIAAVEANPKSIINIDSEKIEELKARVPFDLTGDQVRAIDGICRSLRSPLPMTGLLSGDVGTGKTLAFLIPMVAAHLAGKRAMLMTPNLLLIRQVSMDMEALFPEIALCTVTGSGISGDPKASLVIGTSALLGAMKKGKLGDKPEFLVVDEQHKFSVEQREQLLDTHTNALEATATPIPRTAALATHGAKDLFLLQDVPVVKRIASRILGRDKALEARNAVLAAVLHRGEQAAVIYPLVETDDPDKQLQTVAEAAAQWARKVAPDDIAVLHGRLKDEEKNAVLDAFRKGQKKLLLSSTVIEVGVTLPELKTMLVLGAEKFGVVTLHQLRGRLARKGGEGDFIMFTDSSEPEASERLQLLVDHQDGFELAEKDAEMRGYGDILGLDGDAQSGKTRTVFLGVNIGPKHISFATHLHERLQSAEKAHLAADAVNNMAKKGESLVLA